MGGASRLRGRAARLMDRRGERGVLDQLINAVRAGESRVLVVRGEPGVGKSALLDYLAGHAAGCRVARAAGVESEMELAFAGLHQLLAPMLGHLDRLPGPQRDRLAELVARAGGTITVEGAFSLPSGANLDAGPAEVATRTFGAVFVEVGVRFRELPITPDRLIAALR